MECGLTYRDVERLTRDLASKYRNDGYIVRISVLADIENQGTVPNLFRVKSLCILYSLKLDAVLSWYGFPSAQEPEAALIQQPAASPSAVLRALPAPVSVIVFITCCILAIALVILTGWQSSGSNAWVLEYFQVPVAQVIICFAALQIWYSRNVARHFASDSQYQNAWAILTCSAVCQLAGLLFSQIFGIDSRVNPLTHQPIPLSSLIPELRQFGLTLGGPLRFALMSIGFAMILRAQGRAGRLRRFKRIDWVVLTLMVLYVSRNVVDVVMALVAGKHPGFWEVWNWPTDPLLALLLGQTILLRRSAQRDNEEKGWSAFALGVFLTAIGDVTMWAFSYGYLPAPLYTLSWCVWLPASAAFACAPAFWMTESVTQKSLATVRARPIAERASH